MNVRASRKHLRRHLDRDPLGAPWIIALVAALASSSFAAVTPGPRAASLPNTPDVAIHPSTTRWQVSPTCAIDPHNSNIMLVGAEVKYPPGGPLTFPGGYWSTDGGVTWAGGDTLGPLSIFNDPVGRGAASCAIGPDGRFMFIYDGFSGTGPGQMPVQYADYTTDRGATWSRVLIGLASIANSWIQVSVDNSDDSPYRGNYYVVWAGGQVEFTRSWDGGASWPFRVPISAPGTTHGPTIQVGPHGEVYACYAVYDPPDPDETAIGFNKSLDGGVTWVGAARKITNIRGHRGTPLPNTTITHNSYPSMAVDVSHGPHRGTIYIVWTNVGVPGVNTGTETNIYLARSTDGGNTFGTPIRVNNDVGTQSQWSPRISCDPVTGALAVIFFDRRDDPGDFLARTYLATSDDGGDTWDNFPVSDVSFTPVAGSSGLGDRLGIAFRAGQPLPVWPDLRSGTYLVHASPYSQVPGTPVPAAPTDLSCTSSGANVTLTWTNPTRRADGVTPLSDFAGLRIYRDDVPLVDLVRAPGDTGTVNQYVDSPPQATSFRRYHVSALDSEAPQEGPRSRPDSGYVGPTPSVIVWRAPGVLWSSPDSIVTALRALGEQPLEVPDLNTFGPDLNVHEMVFACLGLPPAKHVITAAEGAALNDFLQGGGHLYVEGADCFNFDPVSAGGYDLRPMFGLGAGGRGPLSATTITGLGDLSGISCFYTGPSHTIDVPLPVTSAPLFSNIPEYPPTNNVVGVIKTPTGAGRAIGVSFEFGFMGANPTTPLNLMSAYVSLLRAVGLPVLATGPATIRDTILANQSGAISFQISNPGTPNQPLTFNITPPNVPWIVSALPGSGTVPADGSTSVSVSLHAVVPPGVYTAPIVVHANDPLRDPDTVMVELTVRGPTPSVSPATRTIDVVVGATAADSVTLSSVGDGTIYYSLAMLGSNGPTLEAFGDSTQTVTGASQWAANAFTVEQGVAITEIQQLLDIPAPTTLEFFVYEQQPGSSTWRKIRTRQVASAAGRAWRTSGAILVQLAPSLRYLIGCGHSGTATALRDDGSSGPYYSSFGTLDGSALGSGMPAPDSGAFATPVGAYAQAIRFGGPPSVSILAPLSGVVGPGASRTIKLNIGHTISPGTTVATLNVFHDAPFQPTIAVPITVRVRATQDITTSALPDRVALLPGIPNPFRGHTEIRYDLPVAAHVRLDVFDVSGRRVRSLVDGMRPAGHHSVPWDARDDGGRRLAPGVYLSLLSAGSEQRRKRIVLLSP